MSAVEALPLFHGWENFSSIEYRHWFYSIDINECFEHIAVYQLCINGRCVNTQGSFYCHCIRGFRPSQNNPTLCIPAFPDNDYVNDRPGLWFRFSFLRSSAWGISKLDFEHRSWMIASVYAVRLWLIYAGDMRGWWEDRFDFSILSYK